jgi:hypothetical protein
MVASSGWIVLSKDPSMRRTPIVAEALRAVGAAVFHLANASIPGPMAGQAFVTALPRIRTAVRRFEVTVVGSVNSVGDVSVVWANGQKLARPHRLK